MATEQTPIQDATARWRYGALAIGCGFISIVGCLTIAVIKFSEAADVASSTGPAIAAISALAGAYFGIQAGSAGKEQSDASRDEAQAQALKFAAIADPQAALIVLGLSDGPRPGGGGGGGGAAVEPDGGSTGLLSWELDDSEEEVKASERPTVRRRTNEEPLKTMTAGERPPS